MSVAEFVLDSVTARLEQLEQEMILIEEQVDAFLELDVVGVTAIDVLILKHEILKHEFSMLSFYRKCILDTEMKMHAFRQVVGFHFALLSKHEGFFLEQIQKIEELQKEIFVKTGGDDSPQAFAVKRGETVEDLLHYLNLFFPYRLVWTIAKNSSVFTDVLKSIVQYRVDTNEQQNKQLFRAVLKDVFRVISKGSSDPFLMLALSEIIVSFFLHDILKNTMIHSIENFEVVEGCRVLANSKCACLKLSEEYTTQIAAKYHPPQTPPSIVFEPILPSVSTTYPYDTDKSHMFPWLSHLVLELRKLATQASVVMMNCILLDLMNLLSSVLSIGGQTVGADESFQFFVVLCSDARLTEQPMIHQFLSGYIPEDLLIPKTCFFVTEFKAVQDFIKMRKIEIPFFLFPFKGNCVDGLVPVEGEDPVEFRGFTVFARPTFGKMMYPLVLCYTGVRTDVAKVYKFQYEKPSPPDFSYQLTATSHGLITHIELSDAWQHRLIKIDVADSCRKPNDVALLSNLLLMCPHKFTRFKLSLIPSLMEIFTATWSRGRAQASASFVFRVVAQMQVAMLKKGLIREDYAANGEIDGEMIEAVKKVVHFRQGEFYIDPKVRSFICR